MRLPAVLQTAELGSGDLRPGPCWLDRLETTRPLRVALLLGLLALLNGFDLGFTLLADRHGRLVELNPVAASFVTGGQWLPLAAYKLALVTVGVSILWRLRRRGFAEWATWTVVLAYVVVVWRWHWFLCVLPSWQPYVPFHPI